jgi:hypothetical protein
LSLESLVFCLELGLYRAPKRNSQDQGFKTKEAVQKLISAIFKPRRGGIYQHRVKPCVKTEREIRSPEGVKYGLPREVHFAPSGLNDIDITSRRASPFAIAYRPFRAHATGKHDSLLDLREKNSQLEDGISLR